MTFSCLPYSFAFCIWILIAVHVLSVYRRVNRQPVVDQLQRELLFIGLYQMEVQMYLTTSSLLISITSDLSVICPAD